MSPMVTLESRQFDIPYGSVGHSSLGMGVRHRLAQSDVGAAVVSIVEDDNMSEVGVAVIAIGDELGCLDGALDTGLELGRDVG